MNVPNGEKKSRGFDLKVIAQGQNYAFIFDKIRSSSASSSFVCFRLVAAAAEVGTRGALAI